MNTLFYGDAGAGYDATPDPTAVIPPMEYAPQGYMHDAGAACPESHKQTLPYLPFVPPAAAPSPAVVAESPAVATESPAPKAVRAKSSSRPPFAVAFLLLGAMGMLVASGGMAVNALLELV